MSASAPSAKIDARILDSSLMSLPVLARWVFVAMVVGADRHGRLIGTDSRLAQKVGVELPQFQDATLDLLSPDYNSSSKAADGARIVRTSDPRGFAVVNYDLYQRPKVGARTLNGTVKPPDPRTCPTTPAALAIAAIFRRRPETSWQPKEILAFKALGKLDLEEIEIVARYYRAEQAKPTGPDGREAGLHRRNLDTFLNNYRGEVDRARAWAAKNPRGAAKPIRAPETKAPDPEPSGFRAWMAKVYPTADPDLPWDKIYPSVKAEYRTEPTN